MIKFTDYNIIIVDMDGTLYYQRPVRISMVLLMAVNVLHLRAFLVVQKYRKLFEQGLNEKERLAQLPQNAAEIVDEWMVKRPLKYVARYKDQQLIAALKEAQKRRVKIVVYSDYPVKEKLEAIDYKPDVSFRSDEIGSMKPDASGITKALELKASEKVLVIGDRDEKDGQMARNMNCDYLILGKTRHARENKYQC